MMDIRKFVINRLYNAKSKSSYYSILENGSFYCGTICEVILLAHLMRTPYLCSVNLRNHLGIGAAKRLWWEPKTRKLTMTNTALQTIVTKALPTLSGEQVTYNADKNVFLTMGYTSGAGNTYYKAIRLSDRVVACYEIGEGYAHTFLNGIRLFCWDGHQAKLIAQKYWGGYDYRVFSESFAKEQSVLMLRDFLSGQLKLMGRQVSPQEVLDYSRGLIDETQRRRLA